MASRWFFQAFDQEMGPVSFQDLAKMIREGTLTEEDRVRRDFSTDWIKARDVIGLVRTAQRLPTDTKAEEARSAASVAVMPLPAEAVAAAPTPKRRWMRVFRFGLYGWLAAGIVLVFAAFVGYDRWSHGPSVIFPKSETPKSVQRQYRLVIPDPPKAAPGPRPKQGNPKQANPKPANPKPANPKQGVPEKAAPPPAAVQPVPKDRAGDR
jgi:hypothetical protein